MLENPIPIVSVIIPTYNRAHVVNQAIESVLRQTHQDYEIIVVDDCSTDNTEEVIKDYVDSRIHYLRHEQNHGAPWARNSGAKIARGKYLAFLDSDDFWYPEFLERQLSVLGDLPPTVGMTCNGLIRKTDESIRIMKFINRALTFDENLIHGAGICTSSFVVRKSAFQKIGGFDVDFNSFQDFDFLLRMSAQYRIKAIDDVLLEYRPGVDSISRNMAAKAQGFNHIINNYRDDILRLGLVNKYYFKLGQYYILSGGLVSGWKWWMQALRNNPLDTKIWKHFILTLGGLGLYRNILILYNKAVDKRN